MDTVSTQPPFIVPACKDHIKVLFEDDSLLVINKPSGLLSLSGKHPLNFDSVHYRLVQTYPTATLLHRLDLGTSGVMIVALNKQINANLTKQFQTRTVAKAYSAILYGQLDQNSGEINAPIARGVFPRQKICLETGKHAITKYQVTEPMNNSTRVDFAPVTGRTHQLRIHSQSIGHPILGCDLYGLTVNGESTVDLASRLQLHATGIAFTHPLSGQRVEVNSPTPF